ncbi:MATE family efflux transporter [Albidovulum sediminicola]|uniref:Multidrug export protein MepA n=1 Tax=Albidovulum sediminicola TaxID=2984331 RepID=A0ABT2Z0E2_9RHOB|nr:MATE family efflux transporter [Defluviimonas sp. WL0075]MCV2864599.1 MATE family efflux transporter [Defluviimonas sp. WL0075]
MVTKSLTRTFWSYTLPAMAALMVSGLYSVVDGIFIGHALGADGLSAVNLAWPLAGVIWAVAMLAGMGGGAQLGAARGAGDAKRQGETLGVTLGLIAVLGAATGALILALGPAFLTAQGAEGTLAAMGFGYLSVLGWSAPVIMAGMALPLLLRNLGAPRLATAAMLVGAATNVAFDWLFVLKLGHGLAGAARATLIAEVVVIIVSLAAMARLGVLRALRPGRGTPARAARILTSGFSSMIMALYLSFVVVLHNMLFLQHGGTLTVAAYTVAGYVMSFFYYFSEGVAGGMQPLTSYYHGARDRMRMAQVLKLALMLSLGGGAALTALVVAFPAPVARIFAGHDAALIAEAAHGLRLHLSAMVLDGFIVLSATYFQSVGQARKAALITMGNIAIQLPFLFALPRLMGTDGVWLAMPLSNVALSGIVVWMLWRAHRGVFARAAVHARRALEVGTQACEEAWAHGPDGGRTA